MWEWRDAWILQAVVYAGKQGSIRAIIANADAINVDVPSCDELQRRVRRLEAAGLVNAEPARVRATRTGQLLVRRCSRWRDGIRGVTPRLEVALRERVPLPTQSGSWSLSDADWQTAYDEYCASATAE